MRTTSPMPPARRHRPVSLVAAIGLALAALSSAPTAHAVAKLDSATAVTADRAVAVQGDTVTFTVRVTGVTGRPVPTGSVQVSGVKGVACPPAPLVAGVATCSIPLTWVVKQSGGIPFQAFYGGDALYRKSRGSLELPFVLAPTPLLLKDLQARPIKAGKPFSVRGLKAPISGRPKPTRLLFVAADGPADAVQEVTDVTGRWALDPYRRLGAGSGTAGAVEVWQAVGYADDVQPQALMSVGGQGGLVVNTAFVGVALTGARVAATAEGDGDAPVATVTPTSTGGRLWAVGHDSCRQAPEALPGTRLRGASLAEGTTGTSWVQELEADTVAGAPVEVGLTGTACGHWQLLVVEVPPQG